MLKGTRIALQSFNQYNHRSSIEVLRDVVFALFIREIKTRFGIYRLGLLWAIMEPMVFVLLMSTIRSIRSSEGLFGGETHTIPVPLFFMLGYIPFQLFSKLLTQSAAAINANKGLFHYRQVRPIDALLSRTLLEVLISSSVLLLLMFTFWWFGFNSTVAVPLKFLAAFFLLTLLGSGIGMILCVGQLRFPELSKLIPLLIRPLFFISGLFFSLNDIPTQYHHYLLWNPILHAIELMRSACYPTYTADSVSLGYLGVLALVAIFFGLAMYRLDWKQMVAT